MLAFCGYSVILLVDRVMFDSHALFDGDEGHGHGHGEKGHGHGEKGHSHGEKGHSHDHKGHGIDSSKIKTNSLLESIPEEA